MNIVSDQQQIEQSLLQRCSHDSRNTIIVHDAVQQRIVEMVSGLLSGPSNLLLRVSCLYGSFAIMSKLTW